MRPAQLAQQLNGVISEGVAALGKSKFPRVCFNFFFADGPPATLGVFLRRFPLAARQKLRSQLLPPSPTVPSPAPAGGEGGDLGPSQQLPTVPRDGAQGFYAENPKLPPARTLTGEVLTNARAIGYGLYQSEPGSRASQKCPGPTGEV